MERLLAVEPEGPPPAGARDKEDRPQRLLRFLRAEKFNAEGAVRRLRRHSVWWKEYGMDDFAVGDEYDEYGTMFVCGEDRWGLPLLVARPSVHVPKSEEDSLKVARRCICTLQRCIERLPRGAQRINVIYDLAGAGPANWDPVFSRELVSTAGQQFPERMGRLFVINNSWAMSLFWSLLRVMLDPDTQQKVVFCGADFRNELLGLVEEDHPYLLYAAEVRRLGPRKGAELPLPNATARLRPFAAEEAVAESVRLAADPPTACDGSEKQRDKAQVRKKPQSECKQVPCFEGLGKHLSPLMPCLPPSAPCLALPGREAAR